MLGRKNASSGAMFYIHIFIYIYIYTYTHTHIYTHIYIKNMQNKICSCIKMLRKSNGGFVKSEDSKRGFRVVGDFYFFI